MYRPAAILDPKCSLSPAEEMELLIGKIIKPQSQAGKLTLFAIDEADLPFPNGQKLLFNAQDMVSSGRHWSPTNEKGLCVVYVFRRPSEVATRIVELADYRIFFTLTGRNDRRYLSDLLVGFDDAVFESPEYHFAIHHKRDSDNKDYHKCSPIKLEAKLDKVEKP